MIGVYDLTRMPTTFDVACWMVIARTSGCTHVRFAIEGEIAHHKYSEDIAWRRFGNICVPCCTLAGMTYSVGGKMEGMTFKYHLGEVQRIYNETGRIEKLKPPSPIDKKDYITVTLRESFRNPYRNSKRDEWTRFIETMRGRGTEVVVLDECEAQPLSVEYRMALYCGADMNLASSGGPPTLCMLSDAPYIILNVIPKDQPPERQYDIAKLMTRTGFPPGTQCAWRHDKQIIIWEPENYWTILGAYEDMMAGKFARAA